jgi:hypothetical protein
MDERWTVIRSFPWEPIRSSGTQSDVCPVAGSGGRNSIQEFTAANPYNPSPEKTVGVRFSESTHAERPPSVRRHRRLFLPELSRVTAHALPGTDGCEETRTIDMSLWHYRMTDFGPGVTPIGSHPVTVVCCRFQNARQPFRCDSALRHHPVSINGRPLPCRTTARIPRRLPSPGSSASTQATLPFYGVCGTTAAGSSYRSMR